MQISFKTLPFILFLNFIRVLVSILQIFYCYFMQNYQLKINITFKISLSLPILCKFITTQTKSNLPLNSPLIYSKLFNPTNF